MVFPIDLTPNHGEQHNTATDIARARLLVHQLNAYIQTCQQVDHLMNILDELRGGIRDTTTLFSHNALFRRQFNQLYSSRTLLEELAPIVHGQPQTVNTPTQQTNNYRSSNVRRRAVIVRNEHARNVRAEMNVQSPLRSPTGLNPHSLFRRTPTNYIDTNMEQRTDHYREPTPLQSPVLSPNGAAALNTFLGSPVHIAPSIAELERASRLVLFSEITRPLNDVCPISLNRFAPNTTVAQLVDCGHIFLPQLFNRWFRENTRCPVCRHDVRTSSNTQFIDEGESADTASNYLSSDSNNSPPLDEDEESYVSSSSSSVDDMPPPVQNTSNRSIADVIATINIRHGETMNDIDRLTSVINTMHSANDVSGNSDFAIIIELLERILASTRR